ncbi:MAG TPA: hypothetical protein VN033_02775 [Vulgatibacter sp.]|nr:hypothetical protein [Vulgatibacter sp.]
MADPRTILDRLRATGAGAPLERLVGLALERDLGRPLGEVVEPALVAATLRGALRTWIASDEAQGWILDRIGALRAHLGARRAPLGELVPPSLQASCEELAGRPFSPDREITLFLLDRPPVRALLRHLLLEELLAFGRKLRAPVMENPLARGLGGLGRITSERVRASGAFAAMAGQVVGAVSDELERQLDRRAREYADAALSRVLQRLGDLLCDPARAKEQAELRRALLQGVFELDTKDLAREVDRGEPEVVADILRRGFSAWIERDETEAEIAAAIEATLAPEADRPLGEVLERLGLLDGFVALARPIALSRMRGLVETEAFAAWLAELLGPQAPARPGPKGSRRGEAASGDPAG